MPTVYFKCTSNPCLGKGSVDFFNEPVAARNEPLCWQVHYPWFQQSIVISAAFFAHWEISMLPLCTLFTGVKCNECWM